MSEFITLTQDERDDQIVSFYANQERDKHSHEINITRFEAMLTTLTDGAFKNQIQTLLNQTRSRLAEVNAIINATQSQLPSEERIQSSLTRLRSKGVLPGA